MPRSCNSIITTSFFLQLCCRTCRNCWMLKCVWDQRDLPCSPLPTLPPLRLPNHLPTCPEPVHWANDTTVNLGPQVRALGHGSARGGSPGGSENGRLVNCVCGCSIFTRLVALTGANPSQTGVWLQPSSCYIYQLVCFTHQKTLCRPIASGTLARG